VTYWRMRRRVERYKKLAGRKFKEIPEELITLETEINKLRAKIERMKAEGRPEAEISRVAADLAGLEARLRSLIIQHKL